MKIPPTLLYEKFTPVTPKKDSCKILIVAEVISHYLKDTLEKNTFRDMTSVFLWDKSIGDKNKALSLLV